MTTGCLIALIVPACLLAYCWYLAWNNGSVNEHRRQDALTGIARKVRVDATTTGATLNSAHADAAKAVDIIWQHTRAPAIGRDGSRDRFATYINSDAVYPRTASSSTEALSRSTVASP